MSESDPTTPKKKEIPSYLLLTLGFLSDSKVMYLRAIHGDSGVVMFLELLIALAHNGGTMPAEHLHLFCKDKDVYKMLIDDGLIKIKAGMAYSKTLSADIVRLRDNRAYWREQKRMQRAKKKAKMEANAPLSLDDLDRMDGNG